MRHIVYYYMALGAFATLFTSFVNGQSASNASQFLLTNDDPAISYAPAYCHGNMSECFGAWWDTILPNGTTFKTTGGPFTSFKSAVTSLTFPFKGTSVEVHGILDTQGALVFLQLDDQIVPLNTSTGLRGPSLFPALIHTFDNLDGNSTHTLTLEWAGTGSTPGDGLISLAYFDHLVVGNYRAVVSTVTPVPATQDTQSNPASQTVFGSPSSASASASPAPVSLTASSKGLSGGATAGVVILVVIVATVLAFAIFYNIRLRRRPKAPSGQFRIFIQSRQESRVDSDEPPSPSSSMLKARPHMSLPPVYEYYSKGEQSYLDLESQHNSRTNSEESLPPQPERSATTFDLSKQFSVLRTGTRQSRNAVGGVSTEDRRKTAVSALSIPASAYHKDSDVFSVKMCTLSRPRIAKGSLIASPDREFEVPVLDDAHAGLPDLSVELPELTTIHPGSSRRAEKKRSRQGIGSKLGNTIRKSMKKGVVPPVPPIPPTPPHVDMLGVASSSRSVTSRRSCPPPYAIE